MGLSPDPEKRARQLRNLKRGYPTVQARHGLAEKQVGEQPPAPDQPPPEVAVLAYDESERDEPPATPAAPAEEPTPTPEPEREPVGPVAEPERRGERGAWGEFVDGLFS